jgi:uncharacterized protein (TIGR01244 family)
MQNARKYDETITVGSVPSREDLTQLKDLGYRTLVDVRDEAERFGGAVEKAALQLGLGYTKILAAREAIRTAEVRQFYETVFNPDAKPVYAFSRFGKRPLAFLLLFDALAQGRKIHGVMRAASNFGINLEGDLALRAFIVDSLNTGELKAVVDDILEKWPELARRETPLSSVPRRPGEDDISAVLSQALDLWTTTKDRRMLCRLLDSVCRPLDEGRA